MADSAVAIRWKGRGLEFEGGAPGGPVGQVDGNGRSAPSPVQTLLLSLASCMASDILEIASKMRVPIGSLDVTVEGDRNAEFPRRFHTIRMLFRPAEVAEGDRAKVRRAVQLSHDTYCSVLHSLRTDLAFSSEIEFA